MAGQPAHNQAQEVFSLLLASPTLGDGFKGDAAAWAAKERDPALLGEFADFLRGERGVLSGFVRGRLARGLADPAAVSAAVARGWRDMALVGEARERAADAAGLDSLVSSL